MSSSEQVAGIAAAPSLREMRRKAVKRRAWTRSAYIQWYGGSAETFPYETSIRVDNRFVASGIADRGFRKVPVYSPGVDLRGWSNEITFFGGGEAFDVGWANDVALLDESASVLLVSNSRREWDYEDLWQYTLEDFASSHEAIHVIANPPYTDEMAEQPRSTPVASWRLFGAGAIPGGVTVAGALLLAGGSVTDPIRPNPYVGLFLLLVGIGLAVTAVLVLRDAARRP